MSSLDGVPLFLLSAEVDFRVGLYFCQWMALRWAATQGVSNGVEARDVTAALDPGCRSRMSSPCTEVDQAAPFEQGGELFLDHIFPQCFHNVLRRAWKSWPRSIAAN